MHITSISGVRKASRIGNSEADGGVERAEKAENKVGENKTSREKGCDTSEQLDDVHIERE